MKKIGLFLLFFGLFSFLSLNLSAQTSNTKTEDKGTTVKTCCKSGETTTKNCATPCTKGAGEGHKCAGHASSNACGHGTAAKAANCCANKAQSGHKCCKEGTHQGCQQHKSGTVPTGTETK